MSAPRDPLTSASVTTAWVIVFNKPFYPLYVWWVAGSGVRVSLLTLAALPLFAALPYVARRAPLAARTGLPLVGVADTAFSTLMFGESSGVEAFFAPCAALAAVSFTAAEAWTSRALTALTFVVFAGLRFAAPAGVFPWPPSETAGLTNLNLYSAASLTAFIGLRFAAAR
jgi:hypothetical protein